MRYQISNYDIEADAVNDALKDRVLEIASYLLPEGKQVGRSWQCGSINGEKGRSLHLALDGPQCGLWHDFATGDGGNLLTLWMEVHCLSFRDALVEAAKAVGIEPKSYNKPFPVEALLLLKKAHSEGLTWEEKAKLKSLTKGFK